MLQIIRLFALLLLLSALPTALVSGCSSSPGSSPDGSLAPEQQVVAGMVHLPGGNAADRGGIPVEVHRVDGARIDSGLTTEVGWFQLTGRVDGRVEAHVLGSTLAAEVREASPGHVWINFVTTIVSRYVRTYRVPLREAEAKVLASLAIPEEIDYRSGLGDTWRSRFSATAFAEAAGATPLDAFIDQAVARAAAGEVQAFRLPHPYPTLFRSLHPTLADQHGIGAVRRRAGVGVAQSSQASFWGLVCKGIAKGVEEETGVEEVGWACQLLGWGKSASSTTAEYDTIIGDLNNLQTSVDALATQFEFSAANQAADYVQSQFSTFNLDLNNSDPVSAAELLQRDAGPGGDLVVYLDTLVNNLVGNYNESVPPLGPYYAAQVAKNELGSPSPGGSYMWMDVRTNTQLDEVQTLVDFYLSCLQQGGCLLAEYAHLDSNTFTSLANGNFNRFAASINETQTQIEQLSAVIQRAQQLNAPPTLPSDDVLAYLSRNWLMYRPIQGPATASQIYSNVANFSLGPWPAGTWQTMTLDQLKDLYYLANNLSPGNINQGLYELGVIGSPQPGVDILIYYGTYESGHDYYSQVYNITKDTTANKNYDNPYNYILVRPLPGPDDDAGTLLAAAYPTSVTSTAAQSLLTCLGVYAGGASNQVLTPYVNWISSTSDFTIANNPPPNPPDPTGGWGSVYFHTGTPTGTASASICYKLSKDVSNGTVPNQVDLEVLSTPLLDASALGTPSDPVLTSIIVSPQNATYDDNDLGSLGTVTVYCYATGFYSDGSVRDLSQQSPQLTWSLARTSTTGNPRFDGTVVNQLTLTQGELSDTVTVTATYNGPDAPVPVSGSSTLKTSFTL